MMRFRKVLSAVLASLVLLAFPAYAAAYTAYTTGNVNVRTGPGTDYARIATLAAGRPVDVLACQGSWCRIGYQGMRGWLSASYIERAVGRPPAVVVQPTIIVRPPYRPPYYRPPDYRLPPPYYRPRPNCRIAPGYPCP